MSIDMRDVAFATGGLLVAATIFLTGADKDVKDVAFSPSEQVCPASPPGWKDTSSNAPDGPVLSCERNGWVAILNEDRELSHGYLKDTPGAVFICPATNTRMLADGLCVRGDIPGWPATSSSSP